MPKIRLYVGLEVKIKTLDRKIPVWKFFGARASRKSSTTSNFFSLQRQTFFLFFFQSLQILFTHCFVQICSLFLVSKTSHRVIKGLDHVKFIIGFSLFYWIFGPFFIYAAKMSLVSKLCHQFYINLIFIFFITHLDHHRSNMCTRCNPCWAFWVILRLVQDPKAPRDRTFNVNAKDNQWMILLLVVFIKKTEFMVSFVFFYVTISIQGDRRNCFENKNTL